MTWKRKLWYALGAFSFLILLEVLKDSIFQATTAPVVYVFTAPPLFILAYYSGVLAWALGLVFTIGVEFVLYERPLGIQLWSARFGGLTGLMLVQALIVLFYGLRWRRRLEVCEDEARRLGKAMQYRDLVAGSLSHDLRTPLTVIAMSIHNMRAGTPTQAETLRRLQAGCKRMTNIIDQVMDMVLMHLNSGIKLDLQGGDLVVLARQAIDEAAILWPRAHFSLVTDTPVIAGAWDVTRVARALVNLLSNACKYGDQTSPITVKLVAYDDEVEMSVHNWGNPISHEMMPMLFDPFTRGTKGYGLGLYITAEMIDKHGGTIDVCSNAAVGTTFTIRLPRASR